MGFVNPRELPFAPIRSRGELPHLFKEGGIYFVTFGLFDAVILRESREPIGLDDTWEKIAALSEPPSLWALCIGKARSRSNRSGRSSLFSRSPLFSRCMVCHAAPCTHRVCTNSGDKPVEYQAFMEVIYR